MPLVAKTTLGPLLQAFLEGKGTTASDVIIDTLQSLDIEAQVDSAASPTGI